jgi:hypothetical protein
LGGEDDKKIRGENGIDCDIKQLKVENIVLLAS